jgi:hypothetical protein
VVSSNLPAWIVNLASYVPQPAEFSDQTAAPPGPPSPHGSQVGGVTTSNVTTAQVQWTEAETEGVDSGNLVSVSQVSVQSSVSQQGHTHHPPSAEGKRFSCGLITCL